MKARYMKTLFVAAIVGGLFAATATAKTASLKLYVPADVEIGGKTVAQGEYRVEIQNDQSTGPTVIFYEGRREVARAPGSWVELPSPAAYDSVVTAKNDAGKVVLTKILLKQSKRALAFK